jgi:uncharacterized membrane protein YdfJ with MMPL/SSD domain
MRRNWAVILLLILALTVIGPGAVRAQEAQNGLLLFSDYPARVAERGETVTFTSPCG